MKAGKTLKKWETDINSNENVKSFIENYVLEIIQNVKENYSLDAIGVASPGNPENGIIYNIVNLGMDKLDMASIIKRVYDGKISVRNDAKCAGLAEKTYGSLKNYDDCVFLCLGTGIGGSCFLGGKELVPSRNPGFEIGHMIIQKDGNLCSCGKRGCFETYCSIKKFKSNLVQAMKLQGEVSSKDLVEITKKNLENENVKALIEEYIENLNVGLSNIIDILEPQAICLGGSFVYFEDILYKKLLEDYNNKKYVFNKQNMPKLELASLGNDAGYLGACLI